MVVVVYPIIIIGSLGCARDTTNTNNKESDSFSPEEKKRRREKGWHARGKISKTKRGENCVIFESPHKK